MINIELKGFEQSNSNRQEIDNGKGWIEWRTLDLLYKGGNPEWFYVAACNQYYFDKKQLSNEAAEFGYFIQENFDEAQLLSDVCAVFNTLEFSDWDDFYDKMTKKFIYEE